MPIRNIIDKKRRRVFSEVIGDFSAEEIITTIETSLRHPDFQPGFDILSDHTQIGQPITPQQVELLVAHLRACSESLAGSRWAIATKKPASYGMIKMLSVLAEQVPMSIEAFNSIEEAEKWLGSPRG